MFVCTTAFLFRRYLLTVSDVLNSVRKMEESMMRLQKMRKSKDTQSTGNNGVLSDDDKIRLQLSIDVETFGRKVSKLVYIVSCLLNAHLNQTT